MRLDTTRAQARFAAARVARLATVSAGGRPHLVPVTFAVYADTVAIAVDHKPKGSVKLRRLANIAENPQVSLLVDEYDDDWERLWWVRVDGHARVVAEGHDRDLALTRLVARYHQYRENRPDGQVIIVNALRWTGWSFR